MGTVGGTVDDTKLNTMYYESVSVCDVLGPFGDIVDDNIVNTLYEQPKEYAYCGA